MGVPFNLSMPSILLRLEGLAVFMFAVYMFFAQFRGEPLSFLTLFLFPDISALAYIVNKEIGSVVYNLAHFYVAPLLFMFVSMAIYQDVLFLQLSMIWFAHIGIDRLIGFGLKYPTGFRDTHFQKI